MCLIKGAASVLTGLADIATLIGVIYGFRWVHNFKEQTRLEHQSTEARRALDELAEVENAIQVIFTGTDRERYDAYKQILPIVLNKLRNTLCFLVADPNITGNVKLVDQLMEIIDQFKKNGTDYPTEKIEELLNSTEGHNKLVQLRALLMQMYKLEK